MEGVTSSVALTERLEYMTGAKNLSRSVLLELRDDHVIWEHSANALANLCATLLLVTSVEKIVLGGGIMNRRGLIEKVRERTVALLNGYLELPNDMSDLIATSSYGADVGLTGALVLAQSAYYGEIGGTSNAEKIGSESQFLAGFLQGIFTAGAACALLVALTLNRKK